jgi:hypothetical protein
MANNSVNYRCNCSVIGYIFSEKENAEIEIAQVVSLGNRSYGLLQEPQTLTALSFCKKLKQPANQFFA